MNYKTDKSEQKSKSSNHSHHHHRHHRHSSSKRYRENDPSSEMERRGDNIIYDKIRKERIKQTIKRSVFVLLSIAFISVVVYFMILPSDSYLNFNLFNKGVTEDVNALKNKVTKYEYYIEELEERLSKYEEVESILKNE